MTRELRAGISLAAFGTCLVAVGLAALAIVVRLGGMEHAGIVAGGLTLDLTVVVPGLFYLLVARPRGWSRLTVLPVFLICILIAGQVIPAGHRQVLDLVGYAAVLAELALIGAAVRGALRWRRDCRAAFASAGDPYLGLRESAGSVFGPVAGSVVAYEVALLGYACAGWTRAARRACRAAPGEQVFTLHREVAYVPLIAALALALAVESTAVHLLVRLWSPVAAWTLTALSLYALVWLIGDLQAARLRPVCLSRDALCVRVGLRWTAVVPLARIAAVRDPRSATAADRRAVLKAVLVGAPNRRLDLTAPVTAIGPYGISRRVTTIDLHVDEPVRFDAALAAARGSESRAESVKER
jgi:hypothetical protein